MSTEAPITCRLAGEADLAAMARVYMAAFPQSLTHFFGPRPPALAAIADVLRIPMLSEPACAIVAEREGRLVGYCLAPAQVGRLRAVAFRSAGRFLGRWLAGRYHVGLRPLRALLLDKLAHWRQRRQDTLHAEAHILSLAVHPDYHGRGLGRCLLKAGMAYLAGQRVPAIRLEVRPHNAAASRLYRSFGFREVGETADSQGPWLIMIRDMTRDD